MLDLINRKNINMRQADEDIVFDLLHEEPVDAIPVEWIERSIPFQHPDDQDILISMIEKWKKGNETNEKV